MVTARDIQKENLAGRIKLTAVTIGHGGGKLQFFLPLPHDAWGRAILPHAVLNSVMRRMQGTTISVG